MPKAYSISMYRAIHDPEALAAYGKLALPALQLFGARVLARGLPAHVYDSGIAERTVVLEFESVDRAIAAHESPAYQEALKVLGTRNQRDLRIIESARNDENVG